MLVRSKAPLRLGFAGGGTDIPEYSDVYGGSVLNATINMFAYCTLEERVDNKITFFGLERNENQYYDIEENFEYNGILDLHKGVYERIINDYNGGRRIALSISTYSDAPSGSGLGSSSTMVVAIIKAFVEYLNLPLGEYDIANLAYEIERIDLKLSGGKQDQYSATFGGFNFIEFNKNNSVIVNPLRIKNWIINEFESSLVIYNTGIVRDSADVIDDQKNKIINEKKSVEAMHSLKSDAIKMKEFLLKGEIRNFAEVLGHSWMEKKKVSDRISNEVIDEVFDIAIKNGAYAGKVSGAGGGGFMMFICNPIKVPNIITQLKRFNGQVFRPQFVQYGTKGWRI
ncbi:hypothetical protein HMPREF9628_01524 [Peptoanaerobacter stomatis]|uniref:GHMP kinase, N-terminal domain protein n=1 Tax=Peptoanaerobacter stomatis TaxID=796937 RepID=G9XCE7_9FIRM|nr:dehydrogenase [Peptoanaerobacter stomatis]EHL19340.1 hypothetical protein HMPREF9628_01524 [Peptoanaerobacter stomatis]